MGHRLDNARHDVSLLSTQYEVEAETLASKFRDRMLHLLREGSLDIFDTYPALQSYGWNQTLEWNDEEYVVRVPDWEGQLKINGEWFDEFNKPLLPWLYDAASELINFLQMFEEEDMQKLIGKGVEVSITRESVFFITEE